MLAPIIHQDMSGLSAGIGTLGSALGEALRARGVNAAAQQQQTQQKQQFGSLIDSTIAQGGQLSTLAQALKESGVGPKVGMPLFEKAFQSDQRAQQQSQLQAQKQGAQPQKETTFEKKIQEKTADLYFNTMKAGAQAENMEGTIKRIRDLGEDLGGVTGLAGYYSGTSGSAKELDALGLTLLKPFLEIFNPVGAIPTRKIEMLKEVVTPTAADNRWIREGKLKAAERLAKSAKLHSDKMGELFNEYGSNIPLGELAKYSANSEKIIDDFLSESLKEESIDEKVTFDKLPPPKNREGSFIKNEKTGQIFQASPDGSRWIKWEG